ncbi:MAG: nucleotidyltransferase domain-containing protein [Magnetospirillum sp. WYHS-4]
MQPPDLSLVREFKRRAEAALPGRVARAVLFGSRARGEAEADSDWDVAVFLKDGATIEDTGRLADAAYDLIVESGEFIQPIAFAEGRTEDLQILRTIRDEGILL